MTNIHFAAIEMDGCNEPVFVAANIENNPMVYSINRRKNLSQFSKAIKFGPLHNFEPTPQRHLTIGMFLPKLHQRFAGDDVHKKILSQIEIIGKDAKYPGDRVGEASIKITNNQKYSCSDGFDMILATTLRSTQPPSFCQIP